MRRLILLTAAWLILGSAGSLFAQGVQTGTIRGLVKDQQDLAVPGVMITVTSPALQGPRSTVSDAQGLYVMRALPPGQYQVTFELSGFATITRATVVPLGLVVDQNVRIRAAAVTETVEVVAETPAPIATPIVGANFELEEINLLATPRTLQGIAQLAPAVNENSTNRGGTGGEVGQVVINGAFGFDNVFMVNGVDINDNVQGTSNNLFIEDAIEETQVLTSGISAEFGRFTGGVVNAITKSGGNRFSGSGRINFQNPSWTTQTPFEKCADLTIVASCKTETKHLDTLSKSYEGTFGGPIVADRLWFFLSGRYGKASNSFTLPQTAVGLTSVDTNKRGEIKITGSPASGHTIQGGYLNNPRRRTNNSGVQSLLIDPNSEVDRENPNWYYYTNYKGVLKSNLLVEAQYSKRDFRFLNDGGTSATFGPAVTRADLIAHSPFVGTCYCTFYNAPYLDVSDPNNRNNRQVTGSVTNAWNKGGGHETKVGYEWYRSQLRGGNSQSPTEYVFGADFLTAADGSPVVDSTGRPIPVFVPGESYLSFFPAVKGAVMNVDNHSAYLQDHWTVNRRWSADLGLRFEHVIAKSTGGIVSIDSNRIVPRLAASYDVKGDGNHVAHVTYGQYSGRYNEAQIGANSPVGHPAEIDAIYVGEEGQGYNFGPGFALANYPITPANASVSDPLQNIFMAPGLTSPLVHEFTASYGANLFAGRGYVEATYVGRVTHQLIEDYQTRATGTTDVIVNGISAGVFTNLLYDNATSAEAHRQYQALVFQSQYRVANDWSVNGHYTVQLENKGNYEGEATNQPGGTSLIGNYPEAFSVAKTFPEGDLQSFQRNRFRLWSVYNFGMGVFGDASVSGLW